LALGILFVLLELFIPSGGVLGFLAAVSVVSAIGLAYYHFGPVVGTVVLAAEAVVMPVVVALALRWWPYTPIGRRILIQPPGNPPDTSDEPDHAHALEELVGKWGRAKSPLLPAGAVVVQGRIYDAVSQGQPIEKGQPIEVVEARGNHIVVRISSHESPPSETDEEDILSQPIDSLGLEPLDDPLG